MAVEEIYVIHHSHTDVGYTHDQPVVWDLYRRFLELAIDLAARDMGVEGPHAFRWTVETTFPLLAWLEHAPSGRVDLFLELVRAGRIEVTAMPCNITPLCDTGEILCGLEPVQQLRDRYGIPVRYAMNSDVNGQNWPLVDALLACGIEGFSMAINSHFGGAPWGRPQAFRWVGPSGREILAWNGFSYGYAGSIGIGRSAERLEEFWPLIARHLEEQGYALPALMLQYMHPFGDNGPPDHRLGEFVRAWNERHDRPRLRLATPAQWWALVANHRDRLAAWRGDWTDYWNFGAASSAREVAICREARARMVAADAVWSALAAAGVGWGGSRAAPPGTREAAWRAILLFDEHTWGADCSIEQPDADDTLSQWYHKAAYAYQARSLSLLLARDAAAEVARRVAVGPEDALLVLNPSAEDRTVAGPLPALEAARRRGYPDDPTSARHFLDRETLGASLYLPPTEVPAYGWVVVPRERLRPWEVREQGSAAQVELGRFRAAVDLERGGLRSLADAELGRDLVDSQAPWSWGEVVREEVVTDQASARDALWSPPRENSLEQARGWHPDWQARRTGSRLLEHRVLTTPEGLEIHQRLDVPGLQDVAWVLRLPAAPGFPELEVCWRMEDRREPEAVYVVFPWALSEARVHLDLGPQAMAPERDQIPGTCRDYFTVQRWLDISGAEGGVTLVTPDVPLWQLGGFGFGRNESRFALRRPWLLAFATNNYWSTNFRASQPGRVRARFAVVPHPGPFAELEAHRAARRAGPWLWHPLGEGREGPDWPREGRFLALPRPPVEVLGVLPATEPDALVIRLVNASDLPQRASFGPGVLRPRAARRTTPIGEHREDLAVVDGAFALELGPREVAGVWVKVG